MPFISLIAAIAIGQSLFCLSLLTTRPHTHTRLLLIAVLSACALVMLWPMAQTLTPPIGLRLMLISLWAHLILAPAVWLYTQALTSDVPWRFERRHLRHALPAATGLIVLALACALPTTTLSTLLNGQSVQQPLPQFLGMAAFGLILVWIVQSVAYLWRIQSHLFAYRRRLKDMFANNDHRELRWLTALSAALGLIWLALLASTTLSTITGHSPLPAQWLYALGLPAIWALALYGLSQSPGYEDRYPTDTPAKYRKSALTPEQAQRISAKLDAAMRDHKLYLDSTLSLPALSKRTGIPANHISQTLNETLGTTFFDYISRWRVDAARPLLSDTDQSVLDIALEVGFNSKSAFYSAFRKATGTTPTAFRR